MAGTVGTAYVQIVPSMKGFRKTVGGEMEGAGRDGISKLDRLVGSAGGKVGKTLGGGVKMSFDNSIGTLGTSTLAKLETNVKRAEASMNRANRKAADDAGKLRVEQIKLDEIQAKGNASASQLAAAQERVAAASRKAAESQTIAAEKTKIHAKASDELKLAQEQAAGRVGSVWSSLGSRVSSIGSAIGSATVGAFQTIGSAALAAGGAIASGIVANLDGAIKRVDTLNNYPRVMENLGFNSDESKASIQAITDYFDNGLPGSLDQMAGSVQKFAPIMQGMDKSLGDTTTFTLALNNALLAGGKGMEGASRGMEQYSQMLATGKVDMQSWKILMEVMPGQLNQVAQSMLGAGANSSQLYEALQKGKVSLADMNDAIVKLDQEGLEGFASFSQQAQDATAGIGTAISKLKTGFVKAGASIIEAIGPETIANALGGLKTFIEGVGTTIGGAIQSIKGSGIGEVFSGLAPAIGGVLGMLGPLLTQLPMVGSLFSGLTGPAGIVLGLFVAMWQNSEQLRTAVGNIVAAFSGLAAQIGPVLGPVLTQLSGALSQVALVLGNVLGGALNAVLPLVPALGNVLNALLPIFGAIIGVVGQVAAFLIGTLGGAINAVIGFFANMGAAIGTHVAAFVQKLFSMASQAAQAMQNMKSRIMSAVANIGSLLVSAGANMVAGLVRGITSRIGAVASAITSGLSSAVSKAKAFLGIASPSKLMDREIGQWMAAGVAQGFDTATPSMVSDIRDDLAQVADARYTIPVEWGATATFPYAGTPGAGAGAGGGVVNQTINVQAIDPAAVASVIEARQRAALGA